MNPNGRFWQPTQANELHLPGASILIGGPNGQELPEHSHRFIQISAVYPSEDKNPKNRNGKRTPDYFTQPGTVRVIPTGMPHRGGWTAGMNIVVVHLRDSLLDSIADELFVRGKPEIRGKRALSDAFAFQLLQAVGRELRSPTMFNRAYFESLVHVLAVYLIKLDCHANFLRPGNGPHLDRQQLRRIDEFLEANLTQNVGIVEQAKIVGMGSQRYLEAMRNTTGKSPHQYIIHKRIQKSKRLLAGKNMTLAEISFELGFTSQSHFGAVFRRLTGFTPRHYRLVRGISAARNFD